MATQYGIRWPHGTVAVMPSQQLAHGYVRAWTAVGIGVVALVRSYDPLAGMPTPWVLDPDGPHTPEQAHDVRLGGAT